jgi:anti-sigma B factor antagonist
MNVDCTITPEILIAHVREDQRIVLDLAQVGFIDSSGLGAIVALRKMLGPDRVLELAALSVSVAKVFRLTRMDGVFPIHVDVPGQAIHAR